MDARPHRRDIDGLRAVSVLSVVFYHLDIAAFPGGFAGVDIFFVISGYLITGIILRELAAGTFSLGNFYERRVRRIFPALAVTTVTTLLAAVAVFEPHELAPTFDAARHLAVFASNVFFANQGSYFDAPMAANPLLQTWSLSVEEQFYLIVPLALASIHRYARDHMLTVLIAAAVASLSLGAYRVATFPIKAFFLTQVRCAELLIGSLLAAGAVPALRHSMAQQAAAIAGAVMIAGSIFLMDENWPFPGPGALPVCLGAALVIWAGEGPRNTFVNSLLSITPLVAIGLVSYSVYLIHWPIVVFAKRLMLGELTDQHKAAVVASALVLGALSWRYVETPFRQRNTIASRPRLFATAAALSTLLVAYCVTASARLDRMGRPDAAITAAEATRFPCLIEHLEDLETLQTPTCLTAGGGRTIAAWGDSYAAHYFESLKGIAASSGAAFALFAFGSCPPAIGLKIRERPACQKFNDIILARLLAMNPRVVVLSAHWLNNEKRHTLFGNDIYDGIKASIETLNAAHIKVLVIGPSPVFPIDVPAIARTLSGNASQDAYFARKSNAFDTFFRGLADKGMITYIPAYRPFCNDRMVCRFRDKDQIFFRDSGHMTRAGAEQVTALAAPELARLIGN